MNEQSPESRLCVSSFLRRRARVLALRRRDSRHSFPGLWSVVSGEVHAGEELAIAALREIREETAIAPDSLKLVVRGSSFLVRDDHTRLTWQVHPFLWELLDRSEPRLDDEHVEARWCRVDQLRRLRTVPGLSTALEALLQAERERDG